jgi:hypothetical protein
LRRHMAWFVSTKQRALKEIAERRRQISKDDDFTSHLS